MRTPNLPWRRFRSGLTLIETCLAIVIVGVGITAAVQLLGTCTTTNAYASQQTVGLYLANNIREMLAGVPYCSPQFPKHFGLETGKTLDAATYAKGALDLDDFDGTQFGYDAGTSPIDALWQPVATQTVGTDTGQPFASLARYTQSITVKQLSRLDLSTIFIPTTTKSDDGVRSVQITVSYRPPGAAKSTVVYSTTYLRFADQAQN